MKILVRNHLLHDILVIEKSMLFGFNFISCYFSEFFLSLSQNLSQFPLKEFSKWKLTSIDLFETTLLEHFQEAEDYNLIHHR